MKNNCGRTIRASFTGYIVQAVVNNFVPLLFVTFQNAYSIPLSKITALISINFLIQLTVDLLSAGFVKKIGYRASVLIANGCASLGLIMLTFMPETFADPFVGILISVAFYAVGGGLLEVVVSPLVEACPTENKEQTMSLLHSFYCWGQVGVVLLSTLFFTLANIENWKILALIWALVPIADFIMFLFAPIYTLEGDGEEGLKLTDLFKNKTFWLLMVMMLCAGASELTVSQWASAFAEEGLGVSKTVGDLAGPMAFAALMGASRLLYGKYGDKLDLNRFILFSSILCIASYLCTSLIPNPVFGLIGCAVCGFSVGIFWPGTYSIASKKVKGGGTAMFALLALGGDMGCTLGPALAGGVSGLLSGDLHTGIFSATVFPVMMLVCAIIMKKTHKG